jgi:predicted dehydrogenase
MERVQPTRIAVVGYGYWGSKHVRVLSAIPGVDVTVVESNQTRRDEAIKYFSNVRGVARLDQALDSIDAVVVATPPGSHFEVALEAISAGKHVLVEKPLTTSVAEAEMLVRAADNMGVQLMVGHTFEYNAAVHKLKEIIDSGELGRVRYIDTARLSLGLYQRDVNVIWDLAPHDLSIVSYLLNELPSAVSVWGQRHIGHHHVDVAHVRLEFPDVDTHAVIHTSWLDPCKVRRVTVAGERKMVVYNDMSDTERIRVYDVGVEELEQDPGSHERPVSYRTGDIVSPYVQFREPLSVQDSHFVDCVRMNVTPHTPGRRGADIVRVLAATDESLVLGDGVRVSLRHEDRLVQSHRLNGEAVR